ncbi:MAG: tripartite tricarboxylate transporter TctB family protein [Rhodospirillales bacterium]
MTAGLKLGDVAKSLFRPSPYLIASMVSTLLAAAMWVLVPYQVDKPVSLFGFGPAGLDPKTFPYLVTAGWFLVSLWNVWDAARQPEGQRGPAFAGPAPSVIATLFIAFVYAQSLEPAGFVLSSALVVALLSIYYGARDAIRIAICALGIPGLIFVIFTRLLHVSLPPFPAWLPGGG